MFKIDLDSLNPRKMLKRMASLFLGLLILETLFSHYLTLTMVQMAIFTSIYMLIYTFVELFYLVAVLKYKQYYTKMHLIILIKVIHYFMEWFILCLVSYILKDKIRMTMIGIFLILIAVNIIYMIINQQKEAK